MAPKRKHDPGYKLPEVIAPDRNCCICIPIPNDFNHKMAFLGQLDELGYWWNWERDPDHLGTQAAQVWRNIVDCIREELDMSGCGCGDDSPYPVQERFNENGELEASTDGGVTWELAPERDARNAVILFPPRQEGSTTGECLGAENATAFFKASLETIYTQLALGGGAASAAPAVIALLITVGFPTGLGAVLALVYGLISAVIGLLSASLEGTFDTAFYDEMRCAFFCVIDPDGTITDADIDAIYDQMFEYTSGQAVAMKVVGDLLGMVGAKGWTNAARGDSIPSSDCTDCDCPEGCAAQWNALVISGTPYASDVSYADDYIQFTMNLDYAYISTEDPEIYCFIGSVELMSGSAVCTAHCPPGSVYPSLSSTSPVGGCATTIEFQGDVGSVWRVHMGVCP